MENKTTIRRDWLREAQQIHSGTQIKVKREHVLAALEYAELCRQETSLLLGVLKLAYLNAARLRALKGEAVPPPPKILENDPDIQAFRARHR